MCNKSTYAKCNFILLITKCNFILLITKKKSKREITMCEKSPLKKQESSVKAEAPLLSHSWAGHKPYEQNGKQNCL